MWKDPSDKNLENSVIYADSTLFDVFSFKLIEGDPETCLKEPNTILLSESTAARYFPEGDAIGQTIYKNGADDIYTVTGVVAGCTKKFASLL